MSRYQKLPSKEKGLFKDTFSGNYYAVKYVNGKKFSKTFDNTKAARSWRDSENSHKLELSLDYDCEPNGSRPYTFKELWEKYQKIEFPKLEQSTIQVKLERSKFFDELMPIKLVYFNPDFIDDYILKKKEQIIKTMKRNRFNMDHEIIELRAVLSFYQRNMDFKFVNPIIRQRHFPLGVIQKLPERNKKLEVHELQSFFGAMYKIGEHEGVMAELAETQFYIAGRVSEAAGIRDVSLNMVEKSIAIDKALSWDISTRKFRELKGTKTGKPKYPHMNEKLEAIFKNRLSKMIKGCPYLFHINGRELHYYEIYHAYQRGLKAAGLDKKYSATHIMRHSMAKQSRIATGTLDGAQAMGGWASIKQCEEYADSPSHLQVEASTKVEERLRLVQ